VLTVSPFYLGYVELERHHPALVRSSASELQPQTRFNPEEGPQTALIAAFFS
jgi:hypothetical protein